jgi:hypothetical protein
VSTINGSLDALVIKDLRASDFADVCGIFPSSNVPKIAKEFSVMFFIYGVTKKSLM